MLSALVHCAALVQGHELGHYQGDVVRTEFVAQRGPANREQGALGERFVTTFLKLEQLDLPRHGPHRLAEAELPASPACLRHHDVLPVVMTVAVLELRAALDARGLAVDHEAERA